MLFCYFTTLLFLINLGFAAGTLDSVSDPVYGGEIKVLILADPLTWDPTVSTSQAIARVMYRNVFEGLVSINRHGEIEPALATQWETSEDGLVWTFRLREDVMFHNGDMLEPSDVIAKFERAMDPESGHNHIDYYDSIEKVEAVTQENGSSDIVFTLYKPDAMFLYNMARPDSIIYPAEFTETQGSKPIGTGPFVFADYIAGTSVRLEAFVDYYKEGIPYLDAVTFNIIEDINLQKLALLAGELDMMPINVHLNMAEQFEKIADFKVTKGDSANKILLVFNNANEPLNNVLVRQALTYAIDKSSILLFEYGTLIGTHVSHVDPYFSEVDAYPYDPERARELLAEAGYPNGFTLKLELPKPYVLEKRIGYVIAQQLSSVGINVDIHIIDWETWIKKIFLAGDYDATVIGHAEPRDIGIYGNPDYYYHYDNPEVEKLLEEASHAIEPVKGIEKLQAVADIIAKDAVNVWIISPAYIVIAKKDIYGFWQDQPTNTLDMSEVYRSNSVDD